MLTAESIKVTDRQFECSKLEYAEIGHNLRHLNDLRARAIQNMLTGFGCLMAGLTAVLSQAFGSAENTSKLVFLIAFMGVAITSIAWLIERRCLWMFDLLTKRAVELERRLGETGQITLVSDQDKATAFSAAFGTSFVFRSRLYSGFRFSWCFDRPHIPATSLHSPPFPPPPNP